MGKRSTLLIILPKIWGKHQVLLPNVQANMQIGTRVKALPDKDYQPDGLDLYKEGDQGTISTD